MSQYGAYGYAKAGLGYKAILKHYYSGTNARHRRPARRCASCSALTSQTVSFTGASSACGVGARREEDLLGRRSGNEGARCETAQASSSRTADGDERHRRRLGRRCSARAPTGARSRSAASSVPGKLNAINAVDLEGYMRG